MRKLISFIYMHEYCNGCIELVFPQSIMRLNIEKGGFICYNSVQMSGVCFQSLPKIYLHVSTKRIIPVAFQGFRYQLGFVADKFIGKPQWKGLITSNEHEIKFPEMQYIIEIQALSKLRK